MYFYTLLPQINIRILLHHHTFVFDIFVYMCVCVLLFDMKTGFLEPRDSDTFSKCDTAFITCALIVFYLVCDIACMRRKTQQNRTDANIHFQHIVRIMWWTRHSIATHNRIYYQVRIESYRIACQEAFVNNYCEQCAFHLQKEYTLSGLLCHH